MIANTGLAHPHGGGAGRGTTSPKHGAFAKWAKLTQALGRPTLFPSGRFDDADGTSRVSSANSSHSALASSVASTSSTTSVSPARVRHAAAAAPGTHVLPPMEALATVLVALRRLEPHTAETASWQRQAQALFLRHGPTAATLHLVHELQSAALAPVQEVGRKLLEQAYRHPGAALGAAATRLVRAAEAQEAQGRPQTARLLRHQAQALADLRAAAPADGYLYQEQSIAALTAASLAVEELRAELAAAARILGHRGLSLAAQAGRVAALPRTTTTPGESSAATQAALDAALGHLERAKHLQGLRRSLSAEEERLRLARPEQALARARSIEQLLHSLRRASGAEAEARAVLALRQSLSVAHFLRPSDAVFGRPMQALDAPSRRALQAAVDRNTQLTVALEALPKVPPGAGAGGSIGFGRWLQRQAQAAQQQAVRAIAAADVLAPLALDLAQHTAAVAPTAAQRHDNRSGRAFETLLADELIRHMPASTCAAWQQLGQGAQDALAPLQGAGRAAFALKLRHVLQERGTRPWDLRAPELAQLQQRLHADLSGVDLLDWALDMLSAPVRSGYAVLVRAELLRAAWASLGEVRLEVSEVQLAQQRFYLDAIGPRARRVEQLGPSQEGKSLPEQLTAGAGFCAANVTVMAAHHRRPIAEDDLLAAPSAVLRYHLELEDPHVAHFLATGAVVASGVSGSTNTLMGWLAYLQRSRPDLSATADDVLLGAAALLIHDAGHSLNEVMWTVTHAPGLAGDAALGLQPAHSYHDFQQRFASTPAVQSAIEQAFARLAAYTGALAERRQAATAR